jgi:hypothetical protein
MFGQSRLQQSFATDPPARSRDGASNFRINYDIADEADLKAAAESVQRYNAMQSVNAAQ